METIQSNKTERKTREDLRSTARRHILYFTNSKNVQIRRDTAPSADRERQRAKHGDVGREIARAEARPGREVSSARHVQPANFEMRSYNEPYPALRSQCHREWDDAPHPYLKDGPDSVTEEVNTR